MPRPASTAVLRYAGHNLVSALAAGYVLGVATNVLFAFGHGSLALVIVAIAMSGVYIAIEETVDKAVVAVVLGRDQRSLGLGILAGANAAGDFASTVFVGLMLAARYTTLAFAVPAVLGALGVLWMIVIVPART
jgi:hypothetical protein